MITERLLSLDLLRVIPRVVARRSTRVASLVALQLLTAHAWAGAGAGADADLAARRERVLHLGDAKYVVNNGPKQRGYDTLAATALNGCGIPAWAASMANLPATQPPDDSPGAEPVEMFSLPPLVRYLYQFGDCLSAAQKSQMLDSLTKKQRLTGGGTSNHAVLRATSWYLLAQYFPDAHWTDWDGKQYSSPQLMAILKARLTARTARLYQFGLDEWLSPTYSMVGLFPMLNLVDFAADPAVRALADKEATLEVSVLKAHSFHGVIVPPLTRKNYDQRNAPDKAGGYVPSIGQQVLWYYFGEPEMSDYDLQSRKEPFYITMLAQSKWQPPGASAAPESGVRAAPYSIRMVTPDFGEWGKPTPPNIYGSSYISDDFAIGTGNLVFDPSWYNDHTQTFGILVKSKASKNQIDCQQPYWDSNKGEDNWGTDRSSPFQQMIRYDDSSVVMLFDIPPKDPWVYDKKNRFFVERDNHADALLQMFECRIPQSFDQIVTEPRWVFARQGKVFIAIATLRGDNEYDKVPASLAADYRVMKVREARSALFFRVDLARDDLDFEKFQKQVRTRLPTYDPDASSASFVEADGSRTTLRFELKAQGGSKYWMALPQVTRNGKVLPYDATSVVDSPELKLQSGTLVLKSAARALTISPSTR